MSSWTAFEVFTICRGNGSTKGKTYKGQEVAKKTCTRLDMHRSNKLCLLEDQQRPKIIHHISALCHDSKIAGHAGRWKTLELVSQNHWWPQMSGYIGRYVSTCDMCLRTKVSRQPLVGELNPLPVPDAPWDTISVDFILRFSPYSTFTPPSFHCNYLIPLLQGHMAIHVPSLRLIPFLSLTHFTSYL